MNVQRLLDELISRFPDFAQFVDWVKYVPQGQPLPEGTTHTLKFANAGGADVVVAFRVTGIYATILDLLLRAI